ncbi:MAG: aminotransferase class III-fold pyridoxal phosphate-dependent enzyme [Myxococcota bacterium]
MEQSLSLLHTMRNHSGTPKAHGLTDAQVSRFLPNDADLVRAIQEASAHHAQLRQSDPDLLALPEEVVIKRLQTDYVNFYKPETVNPFVALAARGPWMVTLYGAVLHDSGGYGMLGFGHAPDAVLQTMAKPWVMANIMTASVTHATFAAALKRELGHTRADGCPFDRFICMNSGSESVTVAARIADILTLDQTKDGGRHEGKRPVYLGIERAFHGRTSGPARFSHSTVPTYRKHLASFADQQDLWVVPPNDVAALEATFARADAEGVYIQLMAMEPVQGEGSPGKAMSREFYDAARRLTRAHGTLLLVDSIQAGLRTWGVLSIVDYPGFEDAEAPDMETWSKALNAGQFPMSILGMTERAAALYATGVYGNTMTTNPRGLEIATTVLGMITPEIRKNVREQGCHFVGDLLALQERFPHLITEVVGTGLLFCAELNPDNAAAIGPDSAEERCRMKGLGVIHGGRNALRFTPHFAITDAERALVIEVLEAVLVEMDAEAQQAAK